MRQNAPLRRTVLCPSNLHGRLRFSVLSRLQCLAPRVASVSNPWQGTPWLSSPPALVGADQALPLFHRSMG
ncbi:hypothetical protein [Planomicrobium sp. CPCC 101079]|uniref:hypothetical protein n=1 Tax=Planomicrobium sp. CPCC 101079 TaxID=2599618 RepID=UPI0011B5C599|nr:hypothetical protein [Planomicrobium sp. CPCC 101079]TWT04539.1 hypothetical protein FQV28_08025 [Planomicrobium sp. CPCC 101079]